MIPFLVVKTRAGFAYVRPDHVLAVNSSDPADCTLVMSGGVTIAVAEPAEDVIERLEAEAREEDEALLIKERHNHGHVQR
jgi:hypothetical protein